MKHIKNYSLAMEALNFFYSIDEVLGKSELDSIYAGEGRELTPQVDYEDWSKKALLGEAIELYYLLLRLVENHLVTGVVEQ